ncbi:MAG TPA: hypothetical protein VNH63_12125 [Gemmatimonadales bacterium]|nr:hypothetical protein [Gemmatimonadales bacterium]
MQHAPPDPLKKSANFFQRLDWLVNQAAVWLVEEALNTRHQLEAIMATLDDLNAQLDAIRASDSAEADSLATLGTALTTIIADLQALPAANVLTQDQLDAVVQKATDAATAAAANVATAAAESAQAGGAVPPTP